MIGALVLLSEMKFFPTGSVPIELQVDSTAAISSITTDWIHKDSRWNAIRIHFLRELVRESLFKPIYTNTKDMLADALTKVPSSGPGHALSRARLMGHAHDTLSK